MIDHVFKVIADLLQLGSVQAVIFVIILAQVAAWMKRIVWAKHVLNGAIEAYEFAEREGLLKGLRGYAKFDPFMDRFIAAYRKKFGIAPPPEAKGLAVKYMEQQVVQSKQPPRKPGRKLPISAHPAPVPAPGN